MIPVRFHSQRLLLSVLIAVAVPTCALAQPTKTEPAKPAPTESVTQEAAAPYDNRLTRLSEILGSVHYLRNLCNPGKEDEWRTAMQQLLDKETANEPKRRERLTAAFNRGYRSFASVYTACTAAALVAEERYRIEGATLATEIAARFGN